VYYKNECYKYTYLYLVFFSFYRSVRPQDRALILLGLAFYLFRAPPYIRLHGTIGKKLVTFTFTLPVSELSVVGLALDLIVLQCYDTVGWIV